MLSSRYGSISSNCLKYSTAWSTWIVVVITYQKALKSIYLTNALRIHDTGYSNKLCFVSIQSQSTVTQRCHSNNGSPVLAGEGLQNTEVLGINTIFCKTVYVKNALKQIENFIRQEFYIQIFDGYFGLIMVDHLFIVQNCYFKPVVSIYKLNLQNIPM